MNTDNDPTLIAAMCQAFAECETLSALRDWGAKLTKEEISDHDRELLRAIYTAKLEWLSELENG